MTGKLYHSPSMIIAQLMVDLGIGEYVDAEENLTGWTIFPMHLPEDPDQAILISDSSGRLHNRMMVNGITGEHYAFQILCRSSKDPGTPYVKAKKITELFDEEVRREDVELENEDGDTVCYRVNAISRVGPVSPGGNDGRRFFFSSNFLTSIELISVVSVDTGTGTVT